jgi:DNA polymerase III subunit epsilon
MKGKTMTNPAAFGIFDTETTGLFNFSAPADADGQPRLAHFHMILTDGAGEKISNHDFFVRPDDWSEQDFAQLAEASRIHGITRAKLEGPGATPIGEILDFYVETVRSGVTLGAFNAQYDTKVMRAELRRARRDDMFETTPNVCLMKPMTSICKIPGARGHKWPKLTEALAHLGITLENAHTADADAEGARQVMLFLMREGLMPGGSIAYAKAQPTPTAAAPKAAPKTRPASAAGFPEAF